MTEEARRKYLEGLEVMSDSLVKLGVLYSEEDKPEAAAISAAGSSIMCALVLIDHTLEEIRDALKDANRKP